MPKAVGAKPAYLTSCICSPTGRGRRLRPGAVRVRIPPDAPFVAEEFVLVQTPVFGTGVQRFDSFLRSQRGDVRPAARTPDCDTGNTSSILVHPPNMSHRPNSEANACKALGCGCESRVRLQMEGQADGRRQRTANAPSIMPCGFNSRLFRQLR